MYLPTSENSLRCNIKTQIPCHHPTEGVVAMSDQDQIMVQLLTLSSNQKEGKTPEKYTLNAQF